VSTVVPLLVPALFVLLAVLERVAPGRALPRVPYWWPRGLLLLAVFVAMDVLLAEAFERAFVGSAAPRLASLGTAGGAVAALVVADILGYWLHRAMHAYPRLWRWTHQMHHSAERMDLGGLAQSHPFDMALTLLMGYVAALLLGVTAEAAEWSAFLVFAAGALQHTNVRTPPWIGYVVARPEAHGLHHQRGVHAFNYGNLPLWDLVFGTFRNPRDFPDGAYGFWDGASSQLAAMLAGRDVAAPAYGAGRAAQLHGAAMPEADR